ncbi:MAG TPA: GGDEF domain-containing protein, partial [Acidimicrobiia bacterium]|nr:GGDEF domain-containing protein [Acidimicrobiia bacterium]
MGSQPADAQGTTPKAVEVALRRVRVLTAILVSVRLVTVHVTAAWEIGSLVGALLVVNLISILLQDRSVRTRTTSAIVALIVDTTVVLVVTCLRDGANATAWAVLVLPVIEGAIQFRIPGAIATWTAIVLGYSGATVALSHHVGAATVVQRLVIVFLIALPSSFLAATLVAEIAELRRGRAAAEHRERLLRNAALDGRKSTTLDVDEVLDVLRRTITDMGFCEPQVFELTGETPRLVARPVPHSQDPFSVLPNEQVLAAADHARHVGASVMWPPADDHARRRVAQWDAAARFGRFGTSKLFAVPLSEGETGTIVLVARWPSPGMPPASQTESVELFAAQAGASLRNARTYLELETLKDQLAHDASHDPLTELPNRRRFHEELERLCGHGRPSDSIGVLFLDLDGFKFVNDQFGHDAGNELLVEVAARLRRCVRPGDIVARMGGDEFTVLLTRIDAPGPAIEVADRICAFIREQFILDAGVAQISTSIGIALAPADTADPGDLVRRADGAMYRAKS